MGRTVWTDEISRKMLTIMVEQKDNGNSKYTWSAIAKVFNAQTSLSVSSKQIQNHHSDLKGLFKAWEELQRLTGIAYNPITKEVDVEEQSLERWQSYLERNSRFGVGLVKKRPANLDLLDRLFEGQSAHGVGGCFSPEMAKQTSYLRNSIEDLTINEDEVEDAGETGQYDDVVPNISTAQSICPPPKRVPNNGSSGSGTKRKSNTSIDCGEVNKRQATLDTVVELLSKAADPPSKADRVNEELERLGVAELFGPEYFVEALSFLLSENRHTDGFLALKQDTYKWIYLKNNMKDTSTTIN